MAQQALGRLRRQLARLLEFLLLLWQQEFAAHKPLVVLLSMSKDCNPQPDALVSQTARPLADV
jgi:hypothetical protein